MTRIFWNTFGLGFLESFCQIILPKAGKKIRVIRVQKIRVIPLKITPKA